MGVKTRSEPRRFKNPPIVEAIIAINVSPQPESALVKLQSLSTEMARLGYSFEAAMTSHAMEIAIENSISRASSRDEVAGYQFFSADRRFAFQILKSGLVFSQLGRYETWELFTAEARKVWDIYLGALDEFSLVQFSVRYVNKMFVPSGEPSQEYIRLYIDVPPELPQSIFDPYLRLAFQLADPTGIFKHQQGILPEEREGFVTVLVDNDFVFPATDLSPHNLWSAIDSVREVKDFYFFNMLTDKMKETFDA